MITIGRRDLVSITNSFLYFFEVHQNVKKKFPAYKYSATKKEREKDKPDLTDLNLSSSDSAVITII